MSSVAAIVLGIALFGGGTLGLSPDDFSPADPPGGTPSPDVPIPSDDDGGGGGAAVPGVAALGALVAALAARRRDLSPSAGLGLQPADPVFVFVPGHGQPHGSQAFDDLIDLAGIDDEDVRFFDYRWVEGGADARHASETVPIDAAASALNSYLAAVAGEGREIYLVGFSKGGTTVAELVADWDDGRWGPSGSVAGAALLDPPMAAGPLGWLQSVGRFVGPVPDDGGYDPVRCKFVVFGCDDRRAHLGERSGIDVMVVRNPRAGITSFGDLPDGLAVYDASDGGPGPWDQLFDNPFRLPSRVTEAHEAVLGDPRVADCIVAAARRVGECDLPQRGHPPLPDLSGGPTRSPTAQKVL